MQLISWLTFDLGSRATDPEGSAPKSDEPTLEVQKRPRKEKSHGNETIKIVTVPHPSR